MPFRLETYQPGSLADLIAAPGRARAQALRAAGEARQRAQEFHGQNAANLAGNIGQIASRATGELIDYQQRAPERQFRTMQAENAQLQNTAMKQEAIGQQKERAIKTLALQQNKDGVWTYDRDLLAKEFQAANIGDRLPGVLQGLDAFDETARKVRELKQEGLAGLAFSVLQVGSTPQALNLAVEQAVKNNYLSPQEVGPFLQQIGDDPAKIQEVVLQLASQSPTFSARIETMRQHRATEAQAAATLEATQANQKTTQADREADNTRADQTAAEAARHHKVMEQRPVGGGAPVVIQTSEGWQLVDRRAGTASPITGQGGQAVKQAPSAMERMDSRKFEKASPVLGAMAELSEKINTQQGVYAKLAGGAAKLAAKANLDDDVAEYDALISGFTPLVARSLGHTGVLTQQDVDSVKALFPRPGDSKSLRDRKVARIKSIIGELQDIEGIQPSQAAPQAPPSAVPSYQDYLNRRGGAR